MIKKICLLTVFITSAHAHVGSDINIVPLSKMDMPREAKLQVEKNLQQEKEKGYIESSSEARYSKYLFNLKHGKDHKSLARATDENDPYNVLLRGSINDIKLAFEFSQPHGFAVVGYAPIGGHIKSGWTGIKVFFDDPVLSLCAYSYNDLKLSNGQVLNLNAEATKFLVHDKPTTLTIEGNHNDGYLYKVSWYTRYTVSEIDCASLRLDKTYLDRMVKLANVLDKK